MSAECYIDVACEGCGKLRHVIARFQKPLCQLCAQRSRKRKPIADRFWVMVDKNGPVPAHMPHLGPCWLWMGTKLPRGYGTMGVDGRRKGYAHRVAFWLAHGRQPTPETIHLCDNPSCVKAWPDEFGPAHVIEGTHLENMRDCITKGRSITQTNNPTLIGEAHHRAKLTREVVIRLRQGEFDSKTNHDVGVLFGVSASAVWSARTGRSWKHIT